MFTTSCIYNEDNIFWHKWIVEHAVRWCQKEWPEMTYAVVRHGCDLQDVCAMTDNVKEKSQGNLLSVTMVTSYIISKNV